MNILIGNWIIILIIGEIIVKIDEISDTVILSTSCFLIISIIFIRKLR